MNSPLSALQLVNSMLAADQDIDKVAQSLGIRKTDRCSRTDADKSNKKSSSQILGREQQQQVKSKLLVVLMFFCEFLMEMFTYALTYKFDSQSSLQ